MAFMKRSKTNLILLSFSAVLFIGCTEGEVTNSDKTRLNDYSYKVIAVKNDGMIQNYFIHLTSTDTTASALEEISKKIKDGICSGACNIVLYDDSVSYFLEEKVRVKKMKLEIKSENSNMTPAEFICTIDSIDGLYYVVLANHKIGLLEFDNECYFDYYPLKDAKYKRLKARKLKSESR